MNWENVITEINQNIDNKFDDVLTLVNNSNRIFLFGAGRSGLALKSFAMRLAQLGKVAFFVGDITTPSIKKGDLLILASSSGETKQLINMADVANNVGANIWLWSTSNNNQLARLTDNVTLLAGKSKFANETMVTKQPMGSLFEQSVWLYGDIFTTQYMDKYEISEEFMKNRHANLE